MTQPVIGIVMGSKSDRDMLLPTADTLTALNIPYEWQVISAHRTPERAFEYAKTAEARGLKLIIAGAGGAAHLAGVMAALTILPVLGIPVPSKHLQGLDSLLSTVQMPGGVPVGTLAIGEGGAKNAALLAASILALSDSQLRERLRTYREKQTADVPTEPIK